MKKQLLTATAISLAIPLGGCSGLGVFDFSSSAKRAQASEVDFDLSGYFDRRLSDGKRHLSADRPGHAIEAFRQASYDPRLQAEAYNGLGVAYDRLGRTDLADRFFNDAVKTNPMEFRFARNLARFEGKEMRVRLEANSKAELAKADDFDQPIEIKPLTVQPSAAKEDRNPRATLQDQPSQKFEDAFASLLSKPPVATAQFDRNFAASDMASVGPKRVHLAVTDRQSRTPVEAPKAAVRRDTPQTEQHAFIQKEAGQARIVRVSRNQVRITRSTIPAGAETFAINRGGNGSKSAVTHISSSPNGVTAVAGVEKSDSDLGLTLPDTAERTPLALADAWNTCTSGC